MGAQTTAVVTRQVHFRGEVPPGNYSGITHLRGSLYSLADDKAPSDGFRLVDIRVDSITGSIQSVVDKGYVAFDKYGNRDAEGVAYVPVRGTLLVVGEADSRVVEYAEDGKATGRELSLVPGRLRGMRGVDCCGRVPSRRLLLTRQRASPAVCLVG